MPNLQSPCISQIPDSPEDNVRLWEEGWRERYYQSKFHVDHDHLEEQCRTIVQDYTRGLQWVLQYYYHNVPSWDW